MSDSKMMIGAATAAHQVEGNNINSDSWALENMVHTEFYEKSGDGVDHYNRYKEDIDLLKNAGLNAYRFSIEWARIEPKENEFSIEELNHYRDVIRYCKENGITPVVTLHHFTSPFWVIPKGGWESETIIDDFCKYVEFLCKNLGDELEYVCTINEANMGIQVAKIAERYRKQMMKASADGTVQVGINLEKMMENMKAAAIEKMQIFGTTKVENFTSPRTVHGDAIIMECHTKARDILRKYIKNVKVGITLSLHDIQPKPGYEKAAENEWNEEFSHYLPYIKDDDFIGVQNYTRSVIGDGGIVMPEKGKELTQMQYEFYPEGLEHVIRKVYSEFKGNIMVTENGIATDNDERRVCYIEKAMEGVNNCRKDNIPVLGYFYWSLLDNFEWQKGYSMTFGLIAVDRTNQKRYPKKSLEYLGSFAK